VRHDGLSLESGFCLSIDGLNWNLNLENFDKLIKD